MQRTVTVPVARLEHWAEALRFADSHIAGGFEGSDDPASLATAGTLATLVIDALEVLLATANLQTDPVIQGGVTGSIITGSRVT